MNHSVMHRLYHPDLGILLIRIALGAIFIAHGQMKLASMPMAIGFFGQLGFAPWVAYLVVYTELIGGLLLVLGLFARYAGIALAIDMIVAIVKVHLPHGFMGQGGYEFPLLLVAGSLAVVLMGSGKYSLTKATPLCRECEVGMPKI